jgi:hypothetical protein
MYFVVAVGIALLVIVLHLVGTNLHH